MNTNLHRPTAAGIAKSPQIPDQRSSRFMSAVSGIARRMRSLPALTLALGLGSAGINTGCGEGTNAVESTRYSDFSLENIDPDGDGSVDRVRLLDALGGELKTFDVSNLLIDCAENDPDVYPRAREIEDSKDNDCDGITDEGTDAYDDDRDGKSENGGDCDDTNPAIPTNDKEFENGVDDDCDGDIDEELDRDGDGYTEERGDQDDRNSARYPGAPETCNNKDDDFNGEVDETADCDRDGFDREEGDCDDYNNQAYPGATEIAGDLVDQDCDGEDEPAPIQTDADHDGFATSELGGTDCDDFNNTTYPGAPETADGQDNNCGEGQQIDTNGDGRADETNTKDEGLDTADQDGDGYCVNPVSGTNLCAYGNNGPGDCNDTNRSINPSAIDIPYDGVDQDCRGGDKVDVDNDGSIAEQVGGPDCNDNDDDVNPSHPEVLNNQVDDDCDGTVDEEVVCLDPCADEDNDGFTAGGSEHCDRTDLGPDPDDSDPAVQPGATEKCDGVDNDGDGKLAFTDPHKSPGFQTVTYAVDCDGDGIAQSADGSLGCYGADGEIRNTDELEEVCAVPASEVQEGIIDCNDSIDDIANATDGTCDGDNDGSIDSSAGGGDCDDNDPKIGSNKSEGNTPDGIDNDCSGVVDDGNNIPKNAVAQIPENLNTAIIFEMPFSSDFAISFQVSNLALRAAMNGDSGQTIADFGPVMLRTNIAVDGLELFVYGPPTSSGGNRTYIEKKSIGQTAICGDNDEMIKIGITHSATGSSVVPQGVTLWINGDNLLNSNTSNNLYTNAEGQMAFINGFTEADSQVDNLFIDGDSDRISCAIEQSVVLWPCESDSTAVSETFDGEGIGYVELSDGVIITEGVNYAARQASCE